MSECTYVSLLVISQQLGINLEFLEDMKSFLDLY